MPNYIYKAKTKEGKDVKGEIISENKTALAKTLHCKEMILVNAREKGVKKDIEINIFGTVPILDKIVFTRNLQVMISAGLSLPRAMTTLAEQSKNSTFKKALIDIGEKIKKGKSFSDSLGKYPKIFSELYQNMIKVAEESGTMEDVLGTLATQMEKNNELRTKIKGAMLYPGIILTAMTGIGILMLIVVIPKLKETFDELGVELPLTTRLVVGFGDFLANQWYFALAIFAILAFLIVSYFKSKKGKRFLNFVFLKVPIIGPIVQKTNAAYTARTLGSLLESGVPIVRSLEIVSGTLTNVYYKEAMANSIDKVRKGNRFSEVLKDYKNLYPVMMLQMIEVGEETGKTSEILDKLATFFEDSVSESTKNMSSIIEPILMLIIGGFVGFFAISMIQPMYSITNTLQ
jgi:type IV pilus assembly protein PilC